MRGQSLRPPQVLRGGCVDGVPSGGAVGAVPFHDGDYESGSRPEQERCVTEQGVRQITHLWARSQGREEREVPLKRPVKPSTDAISARPKVFWYNLFLYNSKTI